MIDPETLLPKWYLDFLDTYDSLKCEAFSIYFILYLEKVSEKLGNCTLLRPDDRDAEQVMSIPKNTSALRDFLKLYFPDFPHNKSCIVIGRTGWCRDVDEWSYIALFLVKNGDIYQLYYVDQDFSLRPPKLITANFASFFTNLPEAIETAKEKLAIGKPLYRRINDELVPLDINAVQVEVNLKPVKPLTSIIKEELSLHFDAEGFVSIEDYLETVQKLLKMTALEFRLVKIDAESMKIIVQADETDISPNLSSDYFDETLIEALNSIILKYKLNKKFQHIFPYTINHADQTMTIGFCSRKEINALIKHDYIES